MMTLANYGIGNNRHKDPNSAKVLSKCLQIRNRAETLLKHSLKSQFKVTEEKRNDILNLVKDYYSRISFDLIIWNKYHTKQCIIDTILSLDSKFDPYKARRAFRIIENMLINLVHSPWHNEFKKIFTYSGEFRISVSGPLVGVNDVIIAAGFQHSKDCSSHLVLPDDKMPQVDDGESVTSVIFDCYLAEVVFSDIIDVYESCCKAAKQQPEYRLSSVNYHSWIQAYFSERCYQIGDRACTDIQDVLNNLTSYLSKLEPLPGSTISVGDKHDDLVRDKVDSALSRNTPEKTVQERTKLFLSQQSIDDEKSQSRLLSDDMLRIPSVTTERRLVHHNNQYNHLDSKTSSTDPSCLESIQSHHLSNNGYLPPNSRLMEADAYNMTGSIYNSPGNHVSTCQPETSKGSVINSDPPHNDREPLIPKYERRVVNPAKRINSFDKEFDGSAQRNDNSSSYWRFLDEHFSQVKTNHPQTSSNHTDRCQNSSKYGNYPQNRKYELHNGDYKITNSRSYWSCNTCTYNNLDNSETCDMCQSRRYQR